MASPLRDPVQASEPGVPVNAFKVLARCVMNDRRGIGGTRRE